MPPPGMTGVLYYTSMRGVHNMRYLNGPDASTEHLDAAIDRNKEMNKEILSSSSGIYGGTGGLAR